MTKKSLASLSKSVKAPQAIVHIKHSITLRQYKLWVIFLQRFKSLYDFGDKPDEKGFLKISRLEMQEYLGYEQLKEHLKDDLEKLRKEPIIINMLEKDEGSVTHGMGFISEWKLSSKTVRFRLPSFLEDVMKGLDQPKAIFQLINWQIFNHFTGKYEAIIYKLCRDYVGVKNTPYMTIEEFREYVGLKPNEYKGFMDLHRYIIKNPINKINESNLSDITVSYSLRREGKKVIGLYFSAKNKHQTSIPFQEFKQNPAFHFAKVHIETSLQSEYLSLRTSEEIVLCIERANEYGEEQGSTGKAVNYGALYRKSILEGWHIGYAEHKAQKAAIALKSEAEKEAKERQADAERIEKEKELKEEKEKKEKTSKALALFDALPEPEKQALRQEFAETLSDITRKIFVSKGEKSPINRHAFIKFLQEKGVIN
jgi:hypothetical protein